MLCISTGIKEMDFLKLERPYKFKHFLFDNETLTRRMKTYTSGRKLDISTCKEVKQSQYKILIHIKIPMAWM